MDSLRPTLEANFWVAKDNSGAGKAAPVPSSLSRPYPKSVVERGRYPKHTSSPAFTPLDHYRGRLVFPRQQSHISCCPHSPLLVTLSHVWLGFLPTLNSGGEVQRSRWHLVPCLEVCGIKISLSGVLRQSTNFSWMRGAMRNASLFG